MSEEQPNAPSGGAEGGAETSPTPEPQKSPEGEGSSQESWFQSDQWREGISGGDETLAKIAGDFTDPTHLLKSHYKLQTEKSELARRAALAPPGEKAKPEEIQKYREAAGIPEAPEGYLKDFDLPDSIKGEEAGLKTFTDVFHKHNLPAPAAQELMSTMADIRLAETQQAFSAADRHFEEFMDKRVKEVGSRTDAEQLLQAENQFVIDAVGQETVDRESEYLAYDPQTGKWIGFVGNLDILRGSISSSARDQLGDTLGAPPGDPEQVISKIQPRYEELQAKYMDSINSGGPPLSEAENSEKSRLAKQLSAQEQRAKKR